MKISLFNVCVPCDGKIVLYNSLSNKIFVTKDDRYLALGENGRLFQGMVDNETEQKLIRYGFLVQDNENELKQRDLAYYQQIMDSSLGVTIMTTYQCNFRCKYCYEDFKNIRLDEKTGVAIEKYVQKNLRNHSRLLVRWFGGEPLLNMDMIDILSRKFIRVCNQLKRPYSASITTNGYLLTLQTFKWLLECRITTYQITIDGPKSLHDKYRVQASGKGTFETIISNLKDIRDNVRSHTFTIMIRTNCTKETLDYMKEYLTLMSREFSRDPRFSLSFKMVGDFGGKSVKDINEVLGISEEDLYNKLLSFKKPLNYDSYVRDVSPGICYAGRKNDYVISPTGEIMKCTVKLYDERNIIGALDENGNMSIDRDKEAEWLIRSSNIQCESCRVSGRCYQGQCPAASFSSLKKSVESCQYDRVDVENSLKLIAIGCGRLSKSIEVL